MSTAAPPAPGTPGVPRPARLRSADVIRVGLSGPRTRRLRSALSALGIALGITAVITVTGIAESNQAHLLERLDQLGSNLLTASPGQDPQGRPVPLPAEAVRMLGAVGPVQRVSATGTTAANVYRTDLVPAGQTGGLSVLAAQPDLLDVLRGRTASGRWFDQGTQHLPLVVLGATAARLLAVDRPGELVWLSGEHVRGEWYAVLGILQPDELAPGLDGAALVTQPRARAALGWDGTPATVYLRTVPDRIEQVRAVVGATANPAHPDQVAVSRPSDLLRARAETRSALTGLVLALAAVALLTGGIGIANTMVVGVMERRREIGVRRALGARRGQVAVQFLIEACLIALAGGLAGDGAALLAMHAYVAAQGWPVVVPLTWVVCGPVLAVGIGAVAGLYPALRAARLPPTHALRTD